MKKTLVTFDQVIRKAVFVSSLRYFTTIFYILTIKLFLCRQQSCTSTFSALRNNRIINYTTNIPLFEYLSQAHFPFNIYLIK